MDQPEEQYRRSGRQIPALLAGVMKTVIMDFASVRQQLDLAVVSERYSPEATTARLRRMLETVAGGK